MTIGDLMRFRFADDDALHFIEREMGERDMLGR